ncbi:MAG: hypothetical protein CVU81_02640 [Euryarchaeota archaeon HGW-Euryarchaeota-1]|nr:MAG: hypothetical protein CVU81_02640 [Euryarchaeota archaeon HGW-Euryarchaeota-1]
MHILFIVVDIYKNGIQKKHKKNILHNFDNVFASQEFILLNSISHKQHLKFILLNSILHKQHLK